MTAAKVLSDVALFLLLLFIKQAGAGGITLEDRIEYPCNQFGISVLIKRLEIFSGFERSGLF